MLDIYVERWVGADGTIVYPWSIWMDGKQLQHGNRHRDARDAEAEALEFCRQYLERDADRVTRL